MLEVVAFFHQTDDFSSFGRLVRWRTPIGQPKLNTKNLKNLNSACFAQAAALLWVVWDPGAVVGIRSVVCSCIADDLRMVCESFANELQMIYERFASDLRMICR